MLVVSFKPHFSDRVDFKFVPFLGIAVSRLYLNKVAPSPFSRYLALDPPPPQQLTGMDGGRD